MRKIPAIKKISALKISVIFGALLMLASCSEDKGKKLGDFPDATAADSLLYYYGQLRAYEYEQWAVNDTSLRSQKEREAFLRGVRDGLGRVGDDEAYNRGVRLGVRMGINLKKFEDNYDVDVKDEILLASIRAGVLDTVAIPEQKYQTRFYSILGRLKLKRKEQSKAISRRSLVEEARRLKLAKYSDDLYFRIDRKGDGAQVRKGDVIYVNVDYRFADGSDLNMPTPEMVTVGAQGSASVMTQAYCMLTDGGSGVFATSAEAIFGSRTDLLGLNPADVIVVYISVTGIGESSGRVSETYI